MHRSNINSPFTISSLRDKMLEGSTLARPIRERISSSHFRFEAQDKGNRLPFGDTSWKCFETDENKRSTPSRISSE